jgi:Cu+-exporting ATPase
MACCVITAYVMNRIIKGKLQFWSMNFIDRILALDVLDLKIINIQYNDFEDPTSMQKTLPSSTQTVSLRIIGMTCAACVGNIEQAISKLDGVDRVSVSLTLARATVIYNGKRASSNDIERVVRMAGYDATSGDRTAEENMEILAHSKQLKQLRTAFSSAATISSILVSVDGMRLLLPQRFETHYGILFFAVHVLLAGWVQLFNARWIHQKAWSRSAGKLSVNMDTLISLSLILGIVVSMFNVSLQGWRHSQTYFAAGCFLTTVITAGRYLDLVLRRRSAANFTELYRLQSETALVQVRSNEVCHKLNLQGGTNTLDVHPGCLAEKKRRNHP